MDDPQATLSVHLAPNQPQTEGRQVLIVDRDHDSWTATIDLQLQVRHGLVDVLRFDVPPQWTEPFKFDKEVRWELLPIPSENRRQLIIRPLTPISGDYSLRIGGQLVPSMGDRLGVADVVPIGLGKVERFVVLPQQWESEHVVWDRTGLADAQLTGELRKRLALAARGCRYSGCRENIFKHRSEISSIRRAAPEYVWPISTTCGKPTEIITVWGPSNSARPVLRAATVERRLNCRRGCRSSAWQWPTCRRPWRKSVPGVGDLRSAHRNFRSTWKWCFEASWPTLGLRPDCFDSRLPAWKVWKSRKRSGPFMGLLGQAVASRLKRPR